MHMSCEEDFSVISQVQQPNFSTGENPMSIELNQTISSFYAKLDQLQEYL